MNTVTVTYLKFSVGVQPSTNRRRPRLRRQLKSNTSCTAAPVHRELPRRIRQRRTTYPTALTPRVTRDDRSGHNKPAHDDADLKEPVLVRLRESLSSPTHAFTRLTTSVPAPVSSEKPQITQCLRTQPASRQQRRLAAEEVESLLHDYSNGASATELAEKYGVHRLTVARHIERSGGQTRRLRSFEGAQLKRLITEYHAGQSTEALGRKYGVAGSTVARTLRRNGIKLR